MVLSPSLVRTCSVLAIIPVLLLSCGCGGSKLHPVGGKAMVDNQPLTAGMVTFTPDADKGNKATVPAIGQIGSDGSYTLTTNGKPGAPTGWYKVTITPGMPEMGTNLKADGKAPPPPTLMVNARYNSPATSDLSIEVKDSGGPYDLKFTR